MKTSEGFALWLTGLPASGKSSITRALAELLRTRGISVVVLESDVMRRILTPEAGYTDEERDRFYRQLALIGRVVAENGVAVIFDATGNRRSYRDYARSIISSFLEIYVDSPLDVCRKRDPKGIYAKAELHKATNVPGLQSPYEPPAAPEIVLDGRAEPLKSAEIILGRLRELNLI